MGTLSIFNRDGQFVADSREVADMTNVRHADLLEKIDSYVRHLTNGEFRSSDFFIPSTYIDGKGETRRKYDITRKGCDMVANKMTGEKGVLFTATYVTKFEEMEKQIAAPVNVEQFLFNADTIIKIAENWKSEQQLRIAAEQKIEQDRPKVVFADAFVVSEDAVLVREFAKILKQNDIDFGEKRLFTYLRENGYLIRKRGSDWNMPTQKSMNMALFEVKDTLVHHNSGRVTINKTPKLTTKGQFYFINKFKGVEEPNELTH